MSEHARERKNVVIVRQDPKHGNVLLDEYVIEDEREEEQIQSSSNGEDVPCHAMEPFYYPVMNMEAVNRDHSTCPHCGEDLTNRRFYNHLFDHHGYTKSQLDALKTQKRLEQVKKRAEASNKQPRKRKVEVYSCICGTKFASKQGIANHKLKVHGIMPPQDAKSQLSDNIVCPGYGCEMNFSTYMDLAIHVDSYHRHLVTISDAFRIRRVMCPDKMSFLKWKRSMEKATNSEFFMRTTQKVSFANRTILFKCQFSNSRGQPRGRRCEQCPSFIRCCERNSGKFEVVACFGHLGHEHVTETAEARELRALKWREIDEKRNEEGIVDEESVGEMGNEGVQHEIVEEEGLIEEEEHDMTGEEVQEEDDGQVIEMDDEPISIKRARVDEQQRMGSRDLYFDRNRYC